MRALRVCQSAFKIARRMTLFPGRGVIISFLPPIIKGDHLLLMGATADWACTLTRAAIAPLAG